MSMLVRLKPLNPRRGVFCRRYMFRGFRFDVTLGWYEVSDDLAAELKNLTQHDSDPEGVRLFDVMTREEAKAEDEKERVKTPGKSSADAPRAVDIAQARRRDRVVVEEAKEGESLPMLDPDPDGSELADEPNTPEDVKLVGLITTDDVKSKPRSRKPA